MEIITNERLYTLDELMEMWGVSRKRMTAFIKEGKIVPVNLHPAKGTTYRFKQSEVDAFVKKDLLKNKSK